MSHTKALKKKKKKKGGGFDIYIYHFVGPLHLDTLQLSRFLDNQFRYPYDNQT